MATAKQLSELYARLMAYRKKYIRSEYSESDESATRLMINNLLSDVFGYAELEEIKTEYQIRGAYADYVIQLKRKKNFIVEVKSIQLDLSDKHLRQSVNYAANEGIDWILLTNGRQLQCYRVLFGKPVTSVPFFTIDFATVQAVRSSLPLLYLLTKRSLVLGEIETHWRKHTQLTPEALAAYLYSDYVVKYLKRSLKKSANLTCTPDEIQVALKKTLNTSVETNLRLKTDTK